MEVDSEKKDISLNSEEDWKKHVFLQSQFAAIRLNSEEDWKFDGYGYSILTLSLNSEEDWKCYPIFFILLQNIFYLNSEEDWKVFSAKLFAIFNRCLNSEEDWK